MSVCLSCLVQHTTVFPPLLLQLCNRGVRHHILASGILRTKPKPGISMPVLDRTRGARPSASAATCLVATRHKMKSIKFPESVPNGPDYDEQSTFSVPNEHAKVIRPAEDIIYDQQRHISWPRRRIVEPIHVQMAIASNSNQSGITTSPNGSSYTSAL